MQPFKFYSETCGSDRYEWHKDKVENRRESEERENTKYLGAIAK